LEFWVWLPDWGIVHGFIGSQRVEAVGGVAVVLVTSTVSALKTVFFGFSETASVKKFSAAGHGTTT